MSGVVRALPAAQDQQSGAKSAEAPWGKGQQCHLKGAEIIARLEAAGATLLAMPARGYTTQLRQMKFDIVHTALEAYGWQSAMARPPVPSAAEITAMDEAFGWLGLIPEARYVLRRVAGARALVHPLTQRHLFPWRRLAAVLGADHKAVQRWHGQAISLLAEALAAH